MGRNSPSSKNNRTDYGSNRRDRETGRRNEDRRHEDRRHEDRRHEDRRHRVKEERPRHRDDADRERRRDRSRSPDGGPRPAQDPCPAPAVKLERRDRDYERYQDRGGEVRVKREKDVTAIKEERDTNDERRRQNRRNQPENPFQTVKVEGGAPGQGGAPDLGGTSDEDGGEPKEKEKPNFETSGALTEDTNTYRGVIIKYNEPSEARKPKRKWRFYIFKDEKQLPTLPVHRQSAYLLGRDRKIADIPIDHPSCSKQHAVYQYRLVEFAREDGTTGRRIRPYIIDLGSANGTFLNNQKIEPQRYYEVQEKDVLKFGFSSRDYVLLHANSKDEEEDAPVV